MPIVVTYNTAGILAPRDRQMQFLARTLLRARPDVACLQEVGPDLETFARHHLQGYFPYQAHPGGNDPRQLNVAILSRHPIENFRSHAECRFELLDGSRTSRFSRDLLRVDLSLAGFDWSIYTTHLKSMRGGPTAHRQRESEAAEILRLVQEQMGGQPDRRWLLCGDLNDGLESPTVQRLLGGALELCNSLELGSARRTLTFPCKAARHQFDYILFPQRMAPLLLDSRVWPESRASDHCMVSATFA